MTVLNNFDPFITARYENLSKIIYPKITVEDSEFNQFWAIGNVISSVQPPNIESIKKLDDTFRIRWFNCAIPSLGISQSGELLNNIIQNETYIEKVVIEGISTESKICNGNNEKLKIIDYWSNPASIKLNVVAPSDGWLLQLSTNYPGWKVKIDGVEERIYYGDILFRAIKLTKGSHMVEFFYQPASFIIGFIITFCFLCIIILYIILKRRKIIENIST